MKTQLKWVSAVAGGLLLSTAALADTPQLTTGHPHGIQVTGKITMLRLQEKGAEVMAGGDKVEAEVIVQLDTSPKMVFTMQNHDPDPARQQMIETLRQAYLADKPVTIEHKLNPGKPSGQINFVQFGALDLKE